MSSASAICDLQVIHLVGHTPGSIALLYDDPQGEPHLFTGDCLFPGGVSKTWRPEDFDTLLAMVRRRFSTGCPTRRGSIRARQRHQPRRRTPISARVGSAALVTDPVTGGISLTSAAAMGVGGMMGAGSRCWGWPWTAPARCCPSRFLLAGFAAAFSVYSYSKLGAKYPAAGAAQFLLEEYGQGVVSGGLNVFQYVAYPIATALYAAGFAEYFTVVLGGDLPDWTAKAIGAGVVVLFTLVNMVGTRLVGRAETIIIGVESVILVAFIGLGVGRRTSARVLGGEHPNGVVGVLTGAALLYVTYRGFGVVTNTSGEMLHPNKELPAGDVQCPGHRGRGVPGGEHPGGRSAECGENAAGRRARARRRRRGSARERRLPGHLRGRDPGHCVRGERHHLRRLQRGLRRVTEPPDLCITGPDRVAVDPGGPVRVRIGDGPVRPCSSRCPRSDR